MARKVRKFILFFEGVSTTNHEIKGKKQVEGERGFNDISEIEAIEEEVKRDNDLKWVEVVNMIELET